MDCSLPGSSVHEILQARILEPVAMDLPNPGIEPESPKSPSLAGGFFPTEPLGKPPNKNTIMEDMIRIFILELRKHQLP